MYKPFISREVWRGGDNQSYVLEPQGHLRGNFCLQFRSWFVGLPLYPNITANFITIGLRKIAQSVKIAACVREMPASHPGQDTGYTDSWYFCVFPQSYKANSSGITLYNTYIAAFSSFQTH